MDSCNLVSPSPNLTNRESEAVCLFMTESNFRSLIGDILHRLDAGCSVSTCRDVQSLIFLFQEKNEFGYTLVGRVLDLYTTMFPQPDETGWGAYLELALSCKTLQDVEKLVASVRTPYIGEYVCTECGCEN